MVSKGGVLFGLLLLLLRLRFCVVREALKKPGMVLDFLQRDSLLWILAEHPLDKVSAVLADLVPRKLGLGLNNLLADRLVRPVKGEIPQHHNVEHNPKAPDVRLQKEEDVQMCV